MENSTRVCYICLTNIITEDIKTMHSNQFIFKENVLCCEICQENNPTTILNITLHIENNSRPKVVLFL